MIGTVFFCISVAIVILLVVVAVLIFHDHDRGSFFLGMTCVFAAADSVSYICSAAATTKFAASMFSSLYFSCVTLMLLCLCIYIIRFTGHEKSKACVALTALFSAYAVFDVVMLVSNPFTGIALDYSYNAMATVAHWQYVHHLIFDCHLAFSYVMVAFVIVILVARCVSVPRYYRYRYGALLVGIVVVVAVNALFLFVPNNTMFDFSIWLYAIVSFFFWWNSYHYTEKRMLLNARKMILNHLDHPLVLFGYDQTFLMMDQRAQAVFGKVFDKNCTLQQFVENEGMSDLQSRGALEQDAFFQWVSSKSEHKTSYRCEYKILYDEHNDCIGYLIVMTENSLEVDWLTGFASKEAFTRAYRQVEEIERPTSVAVLDLNNLARINNTIGREAGDQALIALAESMRRRLPENADFARLDDANLVAVCQGYDPMQMRLCLEDVKKEVETTDLGCGPLTFRSAVNLADGGGDSVLDATILASDAVSTFKMMDPESAHSSLMDSLAQTLRESDSETEAHVARTRAMGEQLGKRLGLSDDKLSMLALLCLLHDIGKLGIPVEILNKPGKLDAEEWKVMQTHTEKGYRIAKASPELEKVAELILHHHERWDGKGYPNGLEGESIPLLSRIISIIDTYDAMTNDRPYRAKLSPAAACAELERCAGKQFDPHLVAELVAMLQEDGVVSAEEISEEISAEEISRPRGFEEEELVSSDESGGTSTEVDYAKYSIGEVGAIVEIDDNFTLMTGYTAEDVKTYKLNHMDLIFPEDRESYGQLLARNVKEKQEAFIEHRLRRKDGAERYVLCYGKLHYKAGAMGARSDVVIIDVTDTRSFKGLLNRERNVARRNLEFLKDTTRRDVLTHVLNRKAFMDDAAALTLEGRGIIVGIVDIDFFKEFNDSMGHPAGDEILRLMGMLLESAVGLEDLVGRIGGDEFMMALQLPEECTDEEIENRVSTLWKCISAPFGARSNGGTLSMGVAVAKPGETSFHDLYKKADEALYKIKRSGRNGYRIA